MDITNDLRIPGTAVGQDLANYIRGAILADIGRMGGVRVIGGPLNINVGTLDLPIPAGTTVEWDAELDSNGGGNLIHLTGPGTFDVLGNTVLEALSPTGVAIRSSSVGRVIIRNGAVVEAWGHDGINLGVIVLDPIAGSGRRLEVFPGAIINNSNTNFAMPLVAINNRCSVGTIFLHPNAMLTINGIVR